MIAPTSTEMVYVPVPRNLYPLIARTLANALEQPEDDEVLTNPVQPLPDEDPEETGWWKSSDFWLSGEGYGDGDMPLRQLKKIIETPTPIALLDLTAQKPEEWVAFPEVQREAGRTFGQARADLAGMTRKIKTRFGSNGAWPVEVKVAQDGIVYYRIEVGVAEAWRQLSGENEGEPD